MIKLSPTQQINKPVFSYHLCAAGDRNYFGEYIPAKLEEQTSEYVRNLGCAGLYFPNNDIGKMRNFISYSSRGSATRLKAKETK